MIFSPFPCFIFSRGILSFRLIALFIAVLISHSDPPDLSAAGKIPPFSAFRLKHNT